MLRSNCIRKIIMLFAAGLFAGTLSAQQTDDADEAAKRALEREVKVSGNYLYGEATGNTKDEAVKAAKNALISEINKEAANHPERQFAKSMQAKDVEHNIEMIDLMRGNKFRVIAYISGGSGGGGGGATSNQAGAGSSTASNQADGGSGGSAAGNQASAGSSTASNQADGGGGGGATSNQAGAGSSNAASNQADVAVNNQDSAGVEIQPKIEEPQISAPKAPEPASVKNADGLLGQILNTASMREIQKILKENKTKGKVAYGTMDKLTAPEKAYLIVYKRTGEIVAILDKGSVGNRKDLLSSEVRSDAILNQNQVIWFQLF